MREIRILSIRKNTDPRIRSLENDYVRRLKPRIQVRLEDIRQKYDTKTPKEGLLAKEADLITKRITTHCTVALSDKGKPFTSEEFARFIAQKQGSGFSSIMFIIGGAYGLHDQILKKADLVLSLSQMTLTHELARLILLETLYRSFDILHNGSYHKA